MTPSFGSPGAKQLPCRANSPVRAASAASTWSIERSPSSWTPPGPEHRPAEIVLGRAARWEAAGEHHRGGMREDLHRGCVCSPASIPPEATALGRGEGGEPDGHPLVEGAVGLAGIRRRPERLDAEPPKLLFGQARSTRVDPPLRRGVDRDRVRAELSDDRVQLFGRYSTHFVEHVERVAQQHDVHPLADPHVDAERTHARRLRSPLAVCQELQQVAARQHPEHLPLLGHEHRRPVLQLGERGLDRVVVFGHGDRRPHDLGNVGL
jgi:hypothetical protein